MRIVYVGNYNPHNSNDEEGAIRWAFEQLGHEVIFLHQDKGYKAAKVCGLRGDLLLFHKWKDVGQIEQFRGRMPRAFWWFDRIQDNDPTLTGRDTQRTQWMADILPHVEYGFCTDGDWVANCPDPENRAKLRWLTQGVDTRPGRHGILERDKKHYLLFVGEATAKSGTRRLFWLDRLKDRYGSKLIQVRSGLHGPELGQMIGSSRIVLAPDWPMSDRYWSNRLYLTLGYGGFLLHPESRGACYEFPQLRTYDSMDYLDFMIGHWLYRPEERDQTALACHRWAVQAHSYIRRCETILKEIANGRTDQRSKVLGNPAPNSSTE